MRIAVYPGGFDPLHNGHLDLVTRMTHLFDRVIVAVVKGRDQGSFFSWDERINLFKEAVEHLPAVEVEGFDELTVEFAKR
ncbi:MAG TPA: adenylyltransferase/cytidyltransferase family protein, partial [Tepidiformaceae bacterium]|nr:adenylyltransferase/cytidyltransferase family protein [Tepidiformaceae bacterium]